MMERTEVSIYIGLSTLFIALVILVILIHRRGHTHDTHEILSAIEGNRQQRSVHQDKIESDINTIKSWVGRIFDRLGFLRDKP